MRVRLCIRQCVSYMCMCAFACMSVCLYVFAFVCICVSVYIYMSTCVPVCLCICLYELYTGTHPLPLIMLAKNVHTNPLLNL